ncbi:MAG: hypothetical protein R3F61_01415 [Myxococcota bacterium]
MPIEKMPAPALEALLDHTSRLKHDLGKYVRFQGRWLGPDADLDARREALAADLLHTRRGPDGSVDASSVWAEFSGELLGERPLRSAEEGSGTFDLRADPDVARIVDGMAVLDAVIAALRSDSLDEAGVIEGERAAEQVASAIRSLVERVRNVGRRPAGG